MKISLIAAVANNNVIGKDNDLIWRLPADLKYFKQTTTGHHIIMGRKNYESIGKPLPNRTSIIITRQEDYEASGCIVVHSLEEALKAVKNDDEPFIIGGGKIYKQSIAIVNKLYITHIHHDFEGDTFFPEITDKWQIISKKDYRPDEKNKYEFSFVIYKLLKKWKLQENEQH